MKPGDIATLKVPYKGHRDKSQRGKGPTKAIAV